MRRDMFELGAEERALNAADLAARRLAVAETAAKEKTWRAEDKEEGPVFELVAAQLAEHHAQVAAGGDGL